MDWSADGYLLAGWCILLICLALRAAAVTDWSGLGERLDTDDHDEENH